VGVAREREKKEDVEGSRERSESEAAEERFAGFAGFLSGRGLREVSGGFVIHHECTAASRHRGPDRPTIT